ncbi:class I SAM-dependent methyltransferase [Pedobacter sp. AW1-32]|uniref:class I SAM-dependent methyltransferase n=1 Tax=Pedobacter sp. AW1-32 TaxID=3383026 RepID=UPI003FED3DFD
MSNTISATADKNLIYSMNQHFISSYSRHSDDYEKYRPGYPEAILTYLEQNISLNREKSIADVGSGTGIFTELLLKKNYRVTAIEPNAEMRAKAENKLASYTGLTSVNASAEQTTLADNSVDLIAVAQSFHWFHPEQTRQEFKRIAKPGAHLLLIWNILQQRSSFLQDYQRLKDKYTSKKPYQEKINISVIDQFLDPKLRIEQEVYHSRQLDKDGLLGYFRSASYAPLQGDEDYPTLVQELEEIFERHQRNGFVKLEYDAKLFLAPLL